ncbi:AMP-binding protein [Cryptosporangium sp. NPDC051539]|uniref:AMP-binding protein n=1 Tax=Cryptosporangium sp. NPDC051539 TaxID=3363962 RepID=UPI00378AE1F3
MRGRKLVAHLAPDGPRFVAAVAAALDGGPAVLPVPPGPPGTVAALLAELRPDAVVDEAGRVTALPDPAPCADEVAAVVVTSGSTGPPKGVELPAAALRASAVASLATLGARPGARWLACLPLFHIAGLQVLVRALVGGTEPVLGPLGTEAAYTALVPTMLYRALRDGVELSHYDGVLVGGAAAAPDLLGRARDAGVRVVTTYGMTETCGGCVYDGRPLPGVSCHLDADGRVRVSGAVVARGYRRGALFHTVFRTHDLGRIWPDGRLEPLGRADEVIVTGGKKVHAQNVEAALAGDPSVAAAFVAGIADPEWGRRITALVVPADERRPPTLAGLRRHLAAHGPGWTAPRALHLLSDLPRLASGKVDRRAAAALLTHLENEQ